MSRRADISPEAAGLAVSGHRRLAGLRRSEVAMLADVSPEYYAKIERGNLVGVSDGVLEAVARALQLDDAEREHLSTWRGGPTARRRRCAGEGRRPGRLGRA